MSTALQLSLLEDHPAESAYYANLAAHRGWATAADRAMGHLVKQGAPFTADDLNDLMAEVTVEPTTRNAIGGLFMVWHRRKLIERVGFQQSRQNKRRGGVIAAWQAPTRTMTS